MSQLLATTTTGMVRGEALDNGIVFKGIPFAAPPIGPRRFRPPQPVERWEGVRDATRFGPACPQHFNGSSPVVARMQRIPDSQDENCLYLNVWTPATDHAHRPTMVWIHGGGFLFGAGDRWPFDGAAFIRDDVVFVSINYRLGPFGFLYLDDSFDGARHTGNLGLLDQIAALEWVRDNIVAFGGDPNNVTIFGESAGAVSIMTLLGIPTARGLFRRAISQSGTRLYDSTDNARHTALNVLAQAGIQPGDWDALTAISARQLLEASLGITPSGLLWKPVVDGITLPDAPMRQIAAGQASEVDLLVGYNADELRLPRFSRTIPAPNLASLFATSRLTPEEVYTTYATARPGATDQDVYAAIDSDFNVVIPSIRLAEAQLQHTDRVWMYRFDWPSPVQGRLFGAFHMLDVPFTFERYDDPAMLGDDPPHQLGRDLHGALVRFAASGDPNGGTLPPWPRYDLHRRETMLFNTPCCTVAEDPRATIRQLWKRVEI